MSAAFRNFVRFIWPSLFVASVFIDQTVLSVLCSLPPTRSMFAQLCLQWAARVVSQFLAGVPFSQCAFFLVRSTDQLILNRTISAASIFGVSRNMACYHHPPTQPFQ